MLETIKHKLISLFQLILVLIYIIFEELIWEGISKPIYVYIHSLKILEKVESRLHSVNAYVILVLFIVLLAMVEALGIYAGLLFVSGKVWHGLTLYLTKVPIAAFTFWMFRITEDKLMTFGWFKWLYEKLLAGIDWLKATEMYKRTMQRLYDVKVKLKVWKEKFFETESRFVKRLKSMYNKIKSTLEK